MAVALSVHNAIRGSIWLLHSFVLYYAIPTASIAYSWTLLFGNSGIVNRVIHEIFGGLLINWLDGNWLFVPLVSFFLIKYCAYPILILLGGLQAIPGDLYEAAAIDGASFMRKTRWITIPLLLPELSFIALLGFFYNFKIYKEAYAMFGAYPPRSIYLVQHFMNNNFIQLNLNRLVASSTLTAAVAALLILLLVRMNRSAYEP
ncbi:carbohydrate ABC transporter permease [Cohnella hashimotonis]|uniref:Sugar ABC transporter permease n=1 Tax=Cohnella hashimotonis TaxID=2826895 RepID=A0ABT6TPK7_9BACL|nr:sugar ABC transporter permease [Cohnella hashimotonis]MDI4647859.1 sugar ABC transporter permease [Cohnella hashimotonis]